MVGGDVAIIYFSAVFQKGLLFTSPLCRQLYVSSDIVKKGETLQMVSSLEG